MILWYAYFIADFKSSTCLDVPGGKENLSTPLKIHALNPKGGGGGPKWPYGFSIGCHFSQDHAMVTKILDFIHIHPK